MEVYISTSAYHQVNTAKTQRLFTKFTVSSYEFISSEEKVFFSPSWILFSEFKFNAFSTHYLFIYLFFH